jgi:rubrerythrin
MTMEVIRKLKEMVERGEYVDPEMFRLNIRTPKEEEKSKELARALAHTLEKETKHSEAYEAALKNLDDSILLYWRRRTAEQIKEYFKQLGKPVPWYLRDYVENASNT